MCPLSSLVHLWLPVLAKSLLYCWHLQARHSVIPSSSSPAVGHQRVTLSPPRGYINADSLSRPGKAEGLCAVSILGIKTCSLHTGSHLGQWTCGPFGSFSQSHLAAGEFQQEIPVLGANRLSTSPSRLTRSKTLGSTARGSASMNYSGVRSIFSWSKTCWLSWLHSPDMLPSRWALKYSVHSFSTSNMPLMFIIQIERFNTVAA